MELTNLSSFISLFAAFNFAYAGSHEFRSIIDNDILKIKTTIQPAIHKEIELIKSSEIAIRQENDLDLSGAYRTHYKELEDKIETIVERSKNAANFSLSFRSIFLFSFYYSLILLVLSGYQEACSVASFNTSILILDFGVFYNLFIFLRSFTKLKSVSIDPAVPSTLFILLILSTILINIKSWFIPKIWCLEINIAIALFVVVSPYLLHFSKLVISKLYYNGLIYLAQRRCKKSLLKVGSAINTLFPTKL